MKRREFLILLAGGMPALPFGAQAQSINTRMIGFLNLGSAQAFAPFLAGFHRGLNATGYAEGRNVAIEYRWAEGNFDLLREQATDLVRRRVDLIVATGGIGS